MTDRCDPEEGGWDDVLGLPTTNRDQLCAFCGSQRPLFAHRLDTSKIQFRSYGKGYTLPSFLTVCVECEDLVARGDDHGLLERMRVHGQFEGEDREHVAAVVFTFRASDLGPTALADHR